MGHDVIIIGGGLGGLECGYILSREGKSVLVLEKGARPGGCLQSYNRRGVTFNTGFHYVGGIGEGQSLHDAFAYLGLTKLPWHAMDEVFDKVTIDGRTFPIAQGFETFSSSLGEFFPGERDNIRGYARDMRHSMGGGYDNFEINAWQYLTGRFRDPLLIDVLSGNALTMELRKATLPLFTFMHVSGGYIESSWRLRGRSSKITDTLEEGIRAHGGSVVCNAGVEELMEADGRLTAARCSNGETYFGETFISDLHPSLTCSLIKESKAMRKIYRRRMASLENTFGMFTASLLVKPRALRYFNHNEYVYRRPGVWTFSENNDPVSGVMISCNVPEDGGDYARQVDLLTPMTWPRCAEWTDTTAHKRPATYTQMKARVAEECIALAETRITGLRDMIDECYTSTPLTYRDYTSTPCGSAYGVRKDCGDALMTMLSPRTPIPNLLLTGQSVILHGVHGVTMTSLHTCGELIGKEYLWGKIAAAV